MIFRLNNPIKNFAWGCKRSFSDLFQIANPEQQPQAEIWMGAHPNGCSTLLIEGKRRSLASAIDVNPKFWLGEKFESYGNQLPFLVKILAAEQPLSIQVHPSKIAAKHGFEQENNLGIAIDAPERNFKDANHKPELIYAITPYLAMNGFRELQVIHKLFSAVVLPSLNDILTPFLNQPTKEALQSLFATILQMDEIQKTNAVKELLNFNLTQEEDAEVIETLQFIAELAAIYPCDVGLFSPLFLNVVELKPGEAMFLFAETPHAYLKGVGVEVMANSDNVLRAGLTPKHIDVPALLANTKFDSIKVGELRMKPCKEGSRLVYPIPVDDFKFDIINNGILDIAVSSPEILLCVDGSVEVSSHKSRVNLKAGESVIIPAATPSYSLKNKGTVARTYY
ncbi:mannose-6-phosphate isomerase, class I [Vibrio cholerae]|uniref:mannose-6-phosphate isomerase, class I n=1 Tax=Vibrio cincinnatiensis TaxID=675 RepID=UPI0012AD1142|nr:mannose-6-phosphate isomerase, class I [Vibrio cincinnatiensis]